MRNKVRNFFYSKNGSTTKRRNCFWMQVENIKYLISYSTVVCAIDEDGKFFKFWDDYSSTTMNQINQFMILTNDDLINPETGEIIDKRFGKKSWLEYPVSKLNYNHFLTIEPYMPQIIENGYGFVEKIIYD